MRLELSPVLNGVPATARLTSGRFALFTYELLNALAHAMTDAKSAVLLCVAWEAIWQERMALGERAGQAVARLSAVKLAELTGCRLQTVQRAISELKRIGVIEVVDESPGKTNVYRLTLNAETLQADN